MEKNPRPEKVAVVEELREKFGSSAAVVFTEYRGLTVKQLFELRLAVRIAGGEYKVYKNSLARRASSELDLDLDDVLTGPTAMAFVTEKPDGTPGDAVLVAKAIKAFAKTNDLLVMKGGRLGDQMLDQAGIIALADVAPRDELLARFAGGLAAPMTNFARVLQALPLNMAYALSALIEAGGASGETVTDEVAKSDDTESESAPEPEAEQASTEQTDADQTDSAKSNNDTSADAEDTGDADASAEEE